MQGLSGDDVGSHVAVRFGAGVDDRLIEVGVGDGNEHGVDFVGRWVKDEVGLDLSPNHRTWAEGEGSVVADLAGGVK